MPKKNVDVSVDHFEWLVDGRSRNQKSTMYLYRIIDANDKKLNKNVELQSVAKELAGIAFSLWRVVFLSDTTGEFTDQWADVQQFLVSLISDNTVMYITDKNARNWSFRYYLDNATYRLSRLTRGEPALLEEADLSRIAESDKDDWLNAQSALEVALTNLNHALQP